MTTIGQIVQAAIDKHVERQGSTGAKYEYLVVGNQCRIDDPTTGGWTVCKWEDGQPDTLAVTGEGLPKMDLRP